MVCNSMYTFAQELAGHFMTVCRHPYPNSKLSLLRESIALKMGPFLPSL